MAYVIKNPQAVFMATNQIIFRSLVLFVDKLTNPE